MPRNVYTVIAMGILFIGSNWVYSHLTQKAAERKTTNLSHIMDQAEAEAGITAEEKDSSETYPVRAMRLAKRMKSLAEAKQKELDSLAQADRQDLGAPPLKKELAGFDDSQ